VLAPLALARIDFYAEGNDLTLSARHGSLDVRFRIDGPIASGPGGRYEVSADGILLLSADDARGYIKSVVRPHRARRIRCALAPHTPVARRCRALRRRRPCCRGRFKLEIAASAALRRTPGARVVAVEEVRFERLLRLHPDRMYAVHIALTPRDRSRVEATLSARHPVEGHGEIRLSRMVVVLGDDAGPAPAPLLQGTALPEPHVPGALYMAASRLHLGGVFATVNGARSDGAVLTG
jgi:hypothetical protein